MAFSSPGETRKALLSVRVREGGAECCCGSCRSVVLLFSPQVRACGGVLVWKPEMGSLLRDWVGSAVAGHAGLHGESFEL